jgi:hypothetical protein
MLGNTIARFVNVVISEYNFNVFKEKICEMLNSIIVLKNENNTYLEIKPINIYGRVSDDWIYRISYIKTINDDRQKTYKFLEVYGAENLVPYLIMPIVPEPNENIMVTKKYNIRHITQDCSSESFESLSTGMSVITEEIWNCFCTFEIDRWFFLYEFENYVNRIKYLEEQNKSLMKQLWGRETMEGDFESEGL